MSEKYTIEITRRTAGDEEKLRTHTSTTPEGAETLVESLMDSYGMREGVIWEAEQLDDDGRLVGRSPTESAIYTITVTPPLRVSQS
jgi:hypothetical protein